MNRVVAFLAQTLSGASGPSAARLAYLAYVAGGFLWLTTDLVLHRGISADWNLAFGVYGSSCTAGYIGGKVAGRPAAPSNGDTPS